MNVGAYKDDYNGTSMERYDNIYKSLYIWLSNNNKLLIPWYSDWYDNLIFFIIYPFSYLPLHTRTILIITNVHYININHCLLINKQNNLLGTELTTLYFLRKIICYEIRDKLMMC